MQPKKIIAVVGPTATGKSDYAVALAKEYGGEVVSADSRQVYRGLDIGSGKITKKEMDGIPHHMIDIVSPKKIYTVADYTRDAERAIADIFSRGKIPILCGGTGFYVDAVLYGMQLPDVPPNVGLRKDLAGKSLADLQDILRTLDPDRFKTIDQKNPRRLIRAIEIAKTIGKVPERTRIPAYNARIIGLDFPDDMLKKRIHDRLLLRMKKGMVQEIQTLHKKGLSWKRMEDLGLEYRYVSRYVRGIMKKDDMLTTLEKEIWHYAKRQRTWFRRNKDIQWQ